MMATVKKNEAAKPKGKAGKGKQRPPRRPPVPPEVSNSRKFRAWELRTLYPRMTYARITEKLNEEFPDFPLKSDHQAVEKMVKEAEKEYIADHKAKVEKIKAEAGVALEWNASEAAEAWEKSKGFIKIVRKKNEQPIEQVLKEISGEPQFLKNHREAVIGKAKIFGALSPRKVELTGKNGADLIPAPAFDFRALGKYLKDDDLEVLQKAAEIIERAQRDHDAAIESGGGSTEAQQKP